MKVVHLNTNLNITSAPYQLHKALLQNGIDSNLLVFNACDLEKAESPKHDLLYKLKRRAAAKKRDSIMQGYNQNPDMYFTALPYGMDVSKHPLIISSDVVMIHWVCGDYLSVEGIGKLLETGKKVFIVCHDNYHFTGGCHVRLGCDKYMNGCGKCPQLKSDNEQDITYQAVKEKVEYYQKYDNYMVLSPSTWMDSNVAKSLVFKDKKHGVLANAINTELFKAYDKAKAREEYGIPQDKKVVLIGIKSNENIPYNGMEYLYGGIEAFKKEDIHFVLFGANDVTNKILIGLQNVGFVNGREKLAMLYSASDVYVTTSLEDSFNQTVAECMACGTPVVAFNNGGIADIIDHKQNGYLAKIKDTKDWVSGVKYVLENVDNFSPRDKIVKNFSYDRIAEKFMEYVNFRNDKNNGDS